MEFLNLNLTIFLLFFILLIIWLIIIYFLYKNELFFLRNWLKLKNFNLSDKKLLYRYIFLGTSLFFLLFSFFKPSLWILSNNEKSWVDIVFLVDVSKSTKALDFKWWISRLDWIKESIYSFISKFSENNYALSVFAWDYMNILPLTSDFDLFFTFLNWINENSSSRWWTNIKTALVWWIDRFNFWDNSWKLIVVFSDFEENSQIFNEEELKWIKQELKEKSINIIFAWVWTTKWAYIPEWHDLFWWIQYKYYNWKKVISKLDEDYLKKMSDFFNWKYIHLEKKEDLLDIKKYISKMDKNTYLDKDLSIKNDYTRYFVIISFIFYLLYLFTLINRNNES